MNEIDARAADWAARFDGADPGPETEQALDAWLAEDVRHVGAFARAQAMLIAYSDSVKGDAGHSVQARPSASATSRRRVLWGSGMAAGLAALGVGGLWLTTAETAYATARGERRDIQLKDGARLTLNTLSAVRVRDGQSGCRVRFIDGEIVIRTAARTTTVVCDDATLSATGAEFGVRRLNAETVLTVISGSVSVDALATPVGAGGRVHLSPDAPAMLAPLDAAALERGLAWRTGRLAFEGDTLGMPSPSSAATMRRRSFWWMRRPASDASPGCLRPTIPPASPAPWRSPPACAQRPARAGFICPGPAIKFFCGRMAEI